MGRALAPSRPAPSADRNAEPSRAPPPGTPVTRFRTHVPYFDILTKKPKRGYKIYPIGGDKWSRQRGPL
jgi:hypothetical protein